MTFSFIGAGGGGGSGAIVTMRSKNFRNVNPSSSEFFQVWDPSDSTLPEPDFCHIMVTTRLPYMNHLTADSSPGCCGAAFGYKVFTKGNVPQKLYAWRGGGGPPSLPYTYSDDAYFSGFNDSPVRGGGYEIPLAALQSAMGTSDTYLAPDAENHYRGDWDVVFNGGNGAKLTTSPFPFGGQGGAGANGTIFGPGGNANDQYGGGTGGNATSSARGPSAIVMHEKVFENWSPMFKTWIQGDTSNLTNSWQGESGKAKIAVPSGRFLLSGGPTNIDTANVILPEPAIPPGSNTINDDVMNFVILSEYF